VACVAHLGEVERDLDRFRSRGCGLLVVSQAKPAVLGSFLKRYPKPYPVVCDPDRAGYRAFGLDRTTWPTIFRPDVTLKYLWRIVTGTRVRVPYRGENVLQLGGDFILDRCRHLVFAHPSRNPTDRPTVAQLLAALSQPDSR
jgi:hypothetical protein